MSDQIPSTIGGDGAGSNNNNTGQNNGSISGSAGANKGGSRKNQRGNRNAGIKGMQKADFVDKRFKDDSPDLGTMMYKYYDCSGLDDQVRYTDTTDHLKIYVG